MTKPISKEETRTDSEKGKTDFPRPDNLNLAKWLSEVHEQVKLTCYDQWPAIVAEQKPLIEQLMAKAKTTNPLSAVIPVVKGMAEKDPGRLLILAVAAEMIMRGGHKLATWE